jgi:hypothetical protein
MSGGSELALLSLLAATAADVATVTKCKIAHTAAKFLVANYVTFSSLVPVGAKTRVLILVKNELTIKTNVGLCNELMNTKVQSVWLRLDAHEISSGSCTAFLGAFTLGGVYRTWSRNNGMRSAAMEKEQMEVLSLQILLATEKYSQVIIHSDFNLDLDRTEDISYYERASIERLIVCTEAACLEQHTIAPT